MKTCLSLLVSLAAVLLLTPTAAAQEKMRIILDTDAMAEVDDQHALAYALFSGDHFEVEGITVNRGSDYPERTERRPYFGTVTIDDHYKEAVNMARMCASSDVPVLKGPAGNYRQIKGDSNHSTFDGSGAVNFIIERAHAPSDRPLHIYAMGNLTNVALALLKDPTIAPKIEIWWMGTEWPQNYACNNHAGDLDAVDALLANPQNVAFNIIPWPHKGVTFAEIKGKMTGRGPRVSPAVPGLRGEGPDFASFGDYSVHLFDKFVGARQKEHGRSLLDMVGLAALKNNVGEFTPYEMGAPSFVVEEASQTGSQAHRYPGTWVENADNPRRVTMWRDPNRDAVYTDFFNTMDNYVLAGSVPTKDVSHQAAYAARAGTIVPIDGPVLAGEPVTFTLKGNPGDPHWQLGDGSTAEGASVTHTYQEPGVYRVVMGSKVGEKFNELSSAILRVHTPETVHLPQVLLDTDARNEIDDQHYIAYGLFSNLDVLGINSIHHGPFRSDRGGQAQEQMNYGEIIHILALCRQSDLLKHRPENQMPLVFHGSNLPLEVPASGNWLDTQPVKTEASEAILAAARGASPDNPVWVLPVGPCTNIGSAILQAREEGFDLASRIKIIWLGGGPEQVNVRSFNGTNDPWSVYVTGRSGAEFWILLENPTGASLALDKRTDLGVYPDNKLGDYLVAISNIWSKSPTKALYDVATISMVIGNHLGKGWLTLVEPSEVLGPDQEYRWKKVEGPTNVQIIREIDAEAMKADFFTTLNGNPTELKPRQ
ncbi:Inosine-uridine preferring nucleoside hydrolase [Cyclobacterium xiamenense]|uniref:Inosine-uridine preferring nucleoside hydrolase n=2 Tax=Cyclobacterium xiamenense TaxID=1297121 RepID=A0A1H6ZU21_9BACT|nr:Inosine-uridine preferring nucleoside hydrolase [Cyclobacterium xiamenense]